MSDPIDDGRPGSELPPVPEEERPEIEANLDWFSRLSPAQRLRVIEAHVRAARRLQGAARRGA